MSSWAAGGEKVECRYMVEPVVDLEFLISQEREESHHPCYVLREERFGEENTVVTR